jgi:hypothetical protein
MRQTLLLIRELVARREVYISDHGYDELAEDDILMSDIVAGGIDAVVIEDYPEYHKEPCVLVLQRDPQGHPIHVYNSAVCASGVMPLINHKRLLDDLTRLLGRLEADRRERAGTVAEMGALHCRAEDRRGNL